MTETIRFLAALFIIAPLLLVFITILRLVTLGHIDLRDYIGPYLLVLPDKLEGIEQEAR